MAYSSSSSPEISVAPSIDTQDQFSYKLASHDEVLEDLSSRFILNLPDEELASLERICFQVEQAHWFYEDFIREENPKFPSLPLKKFSAMLFHACPLLHQWSHDHEQAFNTFMQYKTRVPVCGAIMLNDTWEKCILVKGWKSSSGWGFPKGKINEHEAPHDCAAREVLEETGYNLAGQIDPQDVIEMSIKEQKISLYIVAGVAEDFHFQTRTRKEISRIEWFKLTDLPTWKRNKAAPGKFYLISPFIGALKAFINERRPRALRKTPVKARNSAVTPSHIRQKGAHPSISSQSLSIHHDRSTQETSSQSSSADNGGPHTPSPLYSEQVAHPHANGHTIKTHQEDDLSKTLTTAMDPNLARLLNSLSMSATLPIDDKASAKPNLLEALSLGPAPQTSATPVPMSASSDSPTLLPRREQVDWSSQVPKPLSQRPAEVTHAKPSTPFDPALREQRPLLSARQASSRQLPAALSLSPRPNVESTPSGFRQGSTPPLSAALSSASLNSTSASSNRNPSRRNSSTADISPYLSRPLELPTSGKRLKQLALLETVADESVRFTPQMSAKELLPQVGEPINGAQGFQMPLNGHPNYPPGPSISVPPPPHNMNVLYSSNHGPGQMQSMPYQQLPGSYLPSSNFDDPFTVRPRTSQSVHQAPPFHGHAFAGRPTSMHQNQLLSLLAGPGPQGQGVHGPPPPGSQLIGPFAHPVMGSQPPPNFGSFQHGMPPLPRGPPPLQAMPHNMYPLQSQGMPMSAPSQSPLFNLPPQPNSPTLLSILNGGRSAIPPNIPPPPGVLNGVAHS